MPALMAAITRFSSSSSRRSWRRARVTSGGSASLFFSASFEDGDDHDVGHSNGADQQRDGAQAQEQSSKALWASAWATSAAEGWLTLTSLGFSGLAVAARTESTAATWSVWART